MEHSLREQTQTDKHDTPPPRLTPTLPPLEEAMLRDGESWVHAFSNLRYGVVPTKKPEEVMAYQGLADHTLESDPEMARGYQLCLQEQKAQYVRQKLEEKKAEILRRKREAEQEVARQQAIQRAIREQQQFDFYSRQYPRYGHFVRRPGLFAHENTAVAVGGEEFGDTDSEQALHLDDSIMSSPTYRFVALDDTFQQFGAASPDVAMTVDSVAEAEEYLPDGCATASTRSRRKFPNASQPLRYMANRANPRSTELAQTPPPRFTPAASLGEGELPRNTVHDMPGRNRVEPYRIVPDEPTPPYQPEDEMLQDVSSPVAPPAKSPTLSDLIGSETASEDNGNGADDDSDFDPRSRSPRPPQHRDVQGFGRRSRRTRRRLRR
ncbi:hypothetical protein AYL99_09614 [Fonsecaea erecta]|uniref:Uncharacterized protein n=1 Tax=Fonsecaea erecta TaxID=1367422 RepID=A0A178ZBG7_9EURO|nr:hypothetical protein AYL99_09614 [Fonsecaea erecta]OAP56435.1 hypothetical protein AYL99_09614 [Fonsecaea erecta]